MGRQVSFAPEVTVPVPLRMISKRPYLWNGCRNPYLYKAVVELRSTTGVLHDAVGQPLGLRVFRADPEKGFFLNGKPYHLHGVELHPGENRIHARARCDGRVLIGECILVQTKEKEL